MECVVVSIFKDKNDGTIYREGEKIEVTNKRFKEINSTDAGVLVKEVVAEDENSQDEGTEAPTEEQGAGTGTDNA